MLNVVLEIIVKVHHALFPTLTDSFYPEDVGFFSVLCDYICRVSTSFPGSMHYMLQHQTRLFRLELFANHEYVYLCSAFPVRLL